MKFKRIYILYSIPLIMILLCIFTALFTRFSYTYNPFQYLDGLFTSDTEVFCIGRQPTEIKSLEELFTKSDLIIRGKMTPQRQTTQFALFTNFKISEVCKGDPSLTGKEIVVVEPISLTYFPDGSTPFQTHGGYMPLTEGPEYLLFLTAREWIPEKRLTEFEKSQYLPTYPGAYSSYKLSSVRQDDQKINLDNWTPYQEVKDLDIYSRTPEAIEQYYTMKTQILDKLSLTLDNGV